jgi:hypothetical protein
MAGDVPRRSGKGQYGEREKYEQCDWSALSHSILLSEPDKIMPLSNQPISKG